MMLMISGLLKYSVLSRKKDAHFPSYLRIDITTVRMEDLFVEDRILMQRAIVSNGAQPLAIGPRHTHSDRRDITTCPGPLPQECISLEASRVPGRQRRSNWMAQLRRVLV